MNALAMCGTLGSMYAGLVCRKVYDNKQAVRIAAIFALAGFGMRGYQHKDELSRLLEDEDADVASAALEVMQQMESNAKDLENGSSSFVGLLFPGQGSQYTKMLADVVDIPEVMDLVKRANKILPFDILDICLTATDDELQKTSVCQPVMYVANLIALEKLKKEKPEVMDQVQAIAGLSLGEYSALCVAGVWDFETGLKLVKV